jgi:flagellar biosynthetic protein FliQ
VSDTEVIAIAAKALILAAKLGGPILLVSLGIGLVVSVVQSVTQIQEATLSFVPKLVAIAVVLVVAGHWMLGQLIAFTNELFATLPSLLRG